MTEKKAKKIKLDPRNARSHPDRNRSAVEKSLRELGAGRSIVVDRDGVIVGGNAVYEQAVKLGIPVKEIETNGDELIVVRRVDLATDDPKRKALALADNQIGMLAEWDEVTLEELQTELLGEIDFDVMGFDEAVDVVEEGDVGELVDRAEELNEKWKVERGQVWEIPGKAGTHRVMCGDSTDARDVALLMDGKKGDIVIADPPYGMAYEPNHDPNRVKHNYHGAGYKNVQHQEMIEGDNTPFDPSATMRVLMDISEQFWWGADYYSDKIERRGEGSWLVWDKRWGIEGIKFNSSHFELCWSAKPHLREIIRCKWFGIQGTEKQDVRYRLHPTQKPIQVLEWILERYSKLGGLCIDPFLGSGTTVVAAEQEGRICYGMEIAEKYVAVTLERLSALGLEPVMSDGK